MRRSQSFGMKWHGELHKVVKISEAKDGIISADPITDSHTYYPKDGNIHTTIQRDNRRIDGKLPPFDKLEHPQLFDRMTIQSRPYDSLPGFEIVDVDSFGCEMPYTEVYVCPSEKSIDEINQTYRGEKRIIRLSGMWVVLFFMDEKQPLTVN